ncbi:hypothetical protein U9M48_003560 [Paspalum notatum var. saurae]|uniref:Uncharacterized protein n=1 Tax=Paspalum notatum var. saurae TaxID=547442 RepID=A0AAQ3PT52_PASNO
MGGGGTRQEVVPHTSDQRLQTILGAQAERRCFQAAALLPGNPGGSSNPPRPPRHRQPSPASADPHRPRSGEVNDTQGDVLGGSISIEVLAVVDLLAASSSSHDSAVCLKS